MELLGGGHDMRVCVCVCMLGGTGGRSVFCFVALNWFFEPEDDK